MSTFELVEFNGIKFRRYPESEKREHRVYYTPGGGHILKGVEALHREIWKSIHGPIPPGHHIHHVDLDPLNNDPENLQCLSASDHKRLHSDIAAAEGRYHTDEWLAHLAAIRPLAVNWHRTEEGRAWHREHGKRVAAAQPMISSFCDQCGQEFESKLPDRFCSNRCKSAWRRASGVDDEERSCAVCSSPFTINRYAKTRTCTRACARKLSA